MGGKGRGGRRGRRGEGRGEEGRRGGERKRLFLLLIKGSGLVGFGQDGDLYTSLVGYVTCIKDVILFVTAHFPSHIGPHSLSLTLYYCVLMWQ